MPYIPTYNTAVQDTYYDISVTDKIRLRIIIASNEIKCTTKYACTLYILLIIAINDYKNQYSFQINIAVSGLSL